MGSLMYLQRMLLRSIALQTSRYPDSTQYPFNLPVFQDTKPLAFEIPVTVFVGENGSGKSTLLRAIANAARIHIWESEGLMRSRVPHSPWERALHRYMHADFAESPTGSFFGADAFAEFTRMVDNWAAADPGLLKYYGGASLVAQSHGEGHLAWFGSTLERPGLCLLDEPESALSPRHQVAFVKLMLKAAQGGAQVVAATHSPIIMATPGAQILHFGPERIEPVSFEETEHFRVYREFMEDPEGMFSRE